MSPRLEEILDQVRDAIVAGDILGLAGLEDDLVAVVADGARFDPQTTRRILRKAQRNERLLLAAARGVRSARQRVADIGNAAALTTYDARGRREVLAAPTGSAPRRA